MKKFFYIIPVALILMSCHESLEDRAAREAREYTQKNCPVKIAENIVNDSMTYDKATRTVHYYYSLTGAIDTTITEKEKIRKAMLQGVVNATNLKAYKDAGFKFRYTYFSTKHKGKILFDTTVTEKDYNMAQ